jgi:hypothetical protein
MSDSEIDQGWVGMTKVAPAGLNLPFHNHMQLQRYNLGTCQGSHLLTKPTECWAQVKRAPDLKTMNVWWVRSEGNPTAMPYSYFMNLLVISLKRLAESERLDHVWVSRSRVGKGI